MGSAGISIAARDGLDSGISQIGSLATTEEPWPSDPNGMSERPRPAGRLEDGLSETESISIYAPGGINRL